MQPTKSLKRGTLQLEASVDGWVLGRENTDTPCQRHPRIKGGEWTCQITSEKRAIPEKMTKRTLVLGCLTRLLMLNVDGFNSPPWSALYTRW